MISCREGELGIELPNAYIVYHVDTPETGLPKDTSKVDWAWAEATRYFLCEVKDPEQRGATLHNPTAPAKMRRELSQGGFPKKLAEKASETMRLHPPSAAPAAYIVLLAISTLTAAELQTAGLSIEAELGAMGIKLPVIVVNIAGWNAQLTPRRAIRI